MAGLRAAVVAPAGRLPRWQVRLLERLGIERGVAVVGRMEPAPDGGHSGLKGAYRRWLARRIPMERATAPPGALAEAPLLAGGGSATALDWILHLGPGEPDPRWAAMARWGLWYFRFGQAGDAGTGWGGLAEQGAEAAVVAGELRARGADGEDRLLFRGYTAVESGWPKTRDKLLRAAAEWPGHPAGAALAGADPVAEEPVAGTPVVGAAASSPPVPGWGTLLHERVAAARRGLAGALERNFRLDQWAVGLAAAPAGRVLAEGLPERVTWLPEAGRWRFHADPFARSRGDGGLDLLVETFNHRRGRGELDWLTTDAAGALTGGGPAIHRPEHQSYPYLFDWQGAVYCQPETAAAGTSRRYRARAFPGQWREEAGAGLPAGLVDGTVFAHGDRWWLLGGIQGRGARMQLYAWHAATPLGPWTPHARNPLKCDPRAARPGGRPFVDDGGALIRPAQDCAAGYGRAVVLNRVTTLTPTAYAEEVVARLDPDPAGPYPDGLHTLCPAGDWTVIDGKRSRWQPLKPLLRWWPRGTREGGADSTATDSERG